jgi:polar amino acid transport system substrate-binding protein
MRLIRTLAGPRRLRVAATVVAAAVLGMFVASSAASAETPSARGVLPKGAQIVHPSPPAAPCNATASLRPPAVMPAVGHMPAGSYMAKIQARGYLRVGVDDNTFLWGYRDPVTGSLSGFDIDMLDQISDAIFGSSLPQYIKYVIVPNADRESAVEDGKVDVLAETMTITCARAKKVDFSSVYYEAGQQILVPSNSSIAGPQDLGGKRVCAIEDSTSLQNLAAPSMPRHIQLWSVANQTDCLVMLQQGQVDAISTDNAILVGLEAQDPNTKIVGEAFSSEPYGMAISKAHPDFTSFVNGVLANIEIDGTWTQIYDQTLGQYAHAPAPAPPQATYQG